MADLDHRTMTPPFLRRVWQYPTPGGDTVEVWDLRIGQPNATQTGMPALHSLEHCLLVYLKEASPQVVDAAILGCQTGMKIVVAGTVSFATMDALVASALERTMTIEQVPLANVITCGWAWNHSPEAVRELAAFLLLERPGWANAERASDGREE